MDNKTAGGEFQTAKILLPKSFYESIEFPHQIRVIKISYGCFDLHAYNYKWDDIYISWKHMYLLLWTAFPWVHAYPGDIVGSTQDHQKTNLAINRITIFLLVESCLQFLKKGNICEAQKTKHNRKSYACGVFLTLAFRSKVQRSRCLKIETGLTFKMSVWWPTYDSFISELLGNSNALKFRHNCCARPCSR